jgi:hypothetical protein
MITTSQKARLCEMAQQLKPFFEIDHPIIVDGFSFALIRCPGVRTF